MSARILHLVHRVPYPPNKGDKIRAYNILENLTAGNDVYLATLVDDAADMQSLQSLTGRVCKLMHARVDGLSRKALSAGALISGRSLSVTLFYSKQLQRQIDDLLDETDVDTVLCSSSPMAEYVFRSRHRDGKLASALKVMDLIDVDSHKWAQYADRTGIPLRWIYRYESKVLARYEELIHKRFDNLLLVSERETAYLPFDDEEGKVLAVPNGVNLEFFNPGFESNASRQAPTIVFTGMMDYWPNIEGMRWFISDVYPSIRDVIPDVRLLVVGGRPTAEVSRWGQAVGITVTGFVEDIRDYMSSADVCIAPLRVARGIQNKVLESMAMAKPVVTTAAALEGIDALAERDLVVADEPQDFADAVVGLLADPGMRATIGRSARRFVEDRFTWEHNLRPVGALIAGSVSSGKPSGGVRA